MRVPALTFLLAALVAVPSWADEPASGDAASAGREERPATAPIEGMMIRVELKSGSVFRGVRRGLLYVKLQAGQYVEAKPDEFGAGIRLYFPRLQNGVVTLSMSLVKSVEELGALTHDEGAHLARVLDDSQRRAEEERRRQKEQREFEQLEAEKARLMAEATKTEEPSADALARAARMVELEKLIARFPPGTWTLETPDEIARRRVVTGVAPTEQDMEFLRVFEDWKEAYGLWKLSQETAEKARRELEEAKAAEVAARVRAEAEAKAREDAAKREAERGASSGSGRPTRSRSTQRR